MNCVNESDAKKVSIEKKKELLGKNAIEIATDVKYDIIGVYYGIEKYKTKVLSYPVIVSVSYNDYKKDVELEIFMKKYIIVE